MRTFKKTKTIDRSVLIKFRNRLLNASKPSGELTEFEKGWNKACQYFAHRLYDEVLMQDSYENEEFRKIRI